MDDGRSLRSVEPVLSVRFFRTEAGREPVREWFRARPAVDRLRIGADLKTVQYGWPVGMPLVRKLSPRLWEVRTQGQTTALRVLFTVGGKTMLLLHAFEKASAKSPRRELATARRRLARAWMEDRL